VENFNQILRDRGIDESIALVNLMETKEMQVEKLKNSFLNKLEDSDNLEATVTQIESYASEYDSDTKIMLYKKMGDLFYEKDNPHRATSFYLRIINDLIIKRDSKTLGEISVTLIRIYLQTENYRAAIDLENLIKSEISSFNLTNKSILLFNMGIIHDSLKNHEKALKYFEEVERYIKNPNQIFDVKNFQALSYADLGKTKEATSIYRSLMLKYKSAAHKLTINDNLLYISKIENDLEKIKFYYRKCKNIIKQMLSEKSEGDSEIRLEEALYSLSTTALKLNKKKDTIRYFSELCKEKTTRNIEVKFSAIKELLNLYTKKNLIVVLELEKFYFDLLEREKNLSIGFEFISFYTRENLKDEQERFLEKIKKYY